MADYKRLVSYLYLYENSIKQNNTGYVRIDSRDKKCKVCIHFKTNKIYDGKFKTYFLDRTTDITKGIYLGETICKNSIGESIFILNPDNIMDSKDSLNQIGALVIYINSERFLATEWDDKKILNSDVKSAISQNNSKILEEDKNKEFKDSNLLQEQIKKNMNANNQSQKITDLDNKSQKNFGLGNNSQNNKQVQEKSKLENIPQNKVIQNNKQVQEKGNNSQNKTIQNNKQVQEKSKLESTPQNKVIQNNKQVQEKSKLENTPQNKVIQNNKQVQEKSKLENTPQLQQENESEQEILESEKNKEIQDTSELFNVNNLKLEKQDIDEQKSIILSTQELKMDDNIEDNEPLSASRLFTEYPKMYPFEDETIVDCIRIEPQDIGMFPIEAWVLGNNSFLLHGYYNFKHLIFIKKKEKNSYVYKLGVPALYGNRENFMARMFGFYEFKCVRDSKLQDGSFGYWFIRIYF